MEEDLISEDEANRAVLIFMAGFVLLALAFLVGTKQVSIWDFIKR